MQKFETLTLFLQRFPTEDSCRKHLENLLWKESPKCPHCLNRNKIYRFKNGKLFKCAECNRQFQVTTGTVYEKSNLPLKTWFLAIYLISTNKKGISSIQLAKALGITQKSAWYLGHKIRHSLEHKETKRQLSGVVECDETYVGGRYKGGKRGRGTENKTAVFGMLQRSGRLMITPVKDTKRKTLEPIIRKRVRLGSTIMTDEWWAYNKLCPDYYHGVVQHGKKEYVNGYIHVNSLEGAWSLLKRSLRGIYHRPSRKYMAKYCAEFQFKYNTRKQSETDRFNSVLTKIALQVSYKDIVVSDPFKTNH